MTTTRTPPQTDWQAMTLAALPSLFKLTHTVDGCPWTPPLVSYRAGDLAELVGIGPRDVLNLTAPLAKRWEHHDSNALIGTKDELDRFLRMDCHRWDVAGEIEIVVQPGSDRQFVAALYRE